MQPTSLNQDPPLPCLRALVPPLRLVSAAIWRTVQHRVVSAYGLLDHVITEIAEIVPGLLNCRQRCLLCFNFQAQLVLDLCRPGQTIDLNTLQPHLERMQKLSSLLSKEVNNSAEGMSGPSMLIILIQRLITDPGSRQNFYQDVFPQKYGPEYYKAVELLVMKFLVALERLLVVPNLQQVANMLGSAPSVLAECIAFPLPQELKSLLEHQKDCIHPSNIDVLHTGDSVCTAPSPHSMETILMEEETLLKANMLDDYVAPSSSGQTVDMATAENARMGYDTKDEMSAGDGVTIQPIVVKVYSLEDIACIQQMVPSRSLRVVLDPRAVELHLGRNIKEPEDEKVKLCVRTDGDSTSEGQSSACVKMEPEITMITMKSTPANEHLKSTCMSNVAPASTMANEVTPVLLDLDMAQCFRRKRNDTVLNMTQYFKKKGTKASKTCQICGKTLSRLSHMRRHEMTHIRERPFQCPQCEKSFQCPYNLKRHICHGAGLRPGVATPEDKTAKSLSPNNLSHGCASIAQLPQTAIHPGGICQSALQGTQSLRSHEEVCPITCQEWSSPGEDIPSAAVQENTQPNQAVPGDRTVMERMESTLRQGSDTFEEDKCQVKLEQTCQASEPAVKGSEAILDMLNESASLEGNFCTNKEQALTKDMEAKETNSTPCGAAVKETPKRAPLNTKSPLVCPNCKVKFRSKCSMKKHLVTKCKVKKMTSAEADAAIPGYKTSKENTGRKSKTALASHCAECDISFPDATRLVAHNEIHKPRRCTMCGETFNGFVEVNQHYADAHQFHGPFPCASCNRAFPCLKALISHETVHTGDRPFKCSKCPKLFRSTGTLKRHESMHTRERAFPCKECAKSFRSASELKLHGRYHTGERPFKCRECGKGFVQAYYLTVHMRRHSGETYWCPSCDKSYKRAETLKKHLLTHIGEKPHECSHCEMAFSRPELLKAHMRKFHLTMLESGWRPVVI